MIRRFVNMDNPDEMVLLIEGDPATAKLVQEALTDARYGPFTIEWAETLSDGLDRLRQGGVKAVLLNLFLSDSQGVDTFESVYLVASHVPILILSNVDHEDSAQQAIQCGAQDYLLISHIDGYSISHTLRNVMARKAVEDALHIEKERAQVTLNSIGDAVISTDTDGNVIYLNLVAERMTGWSMIEAVGQPLNVVLKILDGETREPADSPIEMAVQKNTPVALSANSILIRRDGFELHIEDSAAPIHDRSGAVIGAVMVFHDVSESRAMTQKMSHLAQYDYLTDLPNRVLLSDRLAHGILLAQRHRQKLAVLFMDLDLFKNINDSMGHLIGDKLLRSVAERLMNCVRSSDIVSRLGGDEFVVMLSDIEHTDDVLRSAEKILSVMQLHHCIAGYDLHISMSIGISIYPDDGEDAESLINNADTAMYCAKQSGRNRYQLFRKEMKTERPGAISFK